MTRSVTGQTGKVADDTTTTGTRKRTTTRKPPPEPVIVQALCDTCYDVHPVRLTTTRKINDADLLGNLHGACPVCQCETFHLLVRSANDPRCDRRERLAEEERIAQDAELTWHLTELQRLGVRVRHDPELVGACADFTRYLDDGEFVLTTSWDAESHDKKLMILKEVHERVKDPERLHTWCAAFDDPPYVEVSWNRRKDGVK